MSKDKKEPERLKKYLTYQKFYSGHRVVQPSEIIECTEIKARCINFIQPMTLKLME